MQDNEAFSLVARAMHLAALAHEGQRRSHGRKAPYINHVADVARRIAASPASDATTLTAALLHDLAEKTSHSLSEIERNYGKEVSSIVAELTDPPRLKGIAAHRAQLHGAATLSDRAKRIRLADKASKLAEITATPPRWWGLVKARRKVARACEVVERLRGIDVTLEADFDREAAIAKAKLGGA